MSRRINWPLLREVAMFMAPFMAFGAVLALVALISSIAVAAVATGVVLAMLVWAFTHG